ncbi:MAG: DUF3343 domain-containing protein [Cellulosilyticaceae bacterium]
MRQRQLQCVITFKTTTQAMAFEEAAKEAGLSGRLIPLPRVIAAGCGLSWRENPQNREVVETLMGQKQLAYDQIYEVMI